MPTSLTRSQHLCSLKERAAATQLPKSCWLCSGSFTQKDPLLLHPTGSSYHLVLHTKQELPHPQDIYTTTAVSGPTPHNSVATATSCAFQTQHPELLDMHPYVGHGAKRDVISHDSALWGRSEQEDSNVFHHYYNSSFHYCRHFQT